MKKMLSFVGQNISLVVILIAFIVLSMFDFFNFPSALGIDTSSIKWLSDILTLSLGLLTLHFTLTIAKTQRRIEADKIASEKFFKINFIKDYQRIDGDTLKLKIREYDDNILCSIKLEKDIVVHQITEDFKWKKIATMKVVQECTEIEHTDSGLDKEWIENKHGFCYARFAFTNPHSRIKFEKGKTYVFDMSIVATNIFGVEVRCKLYPWFKVYKSEKDEIVFEATHNFGDYESVKYVG
ncbi:hypothetical protein IJG27_04090 [Candidatus Saccharibacteria bacterium]|nr:hypothetical protein [Candidatus Saccharibacteria bacterium]